jgi:hypothetical protein
VDHNVDSGEDILQINRTRREQIEHLDTIDELTSSVLPPSVDEPQVILITKDWEQLARDVPGCTCQQHP